MSLFEIYNVRFNMGVLIGRGTIHFLFAAGIKRKKP